MRMSVVAVGKVRPPLRAAVDEYQKRLRRFATVEEIEVKDLPVPESLSEAERAARIAQESEAVWAAVPKGAFTVVLDARGRMLSSEDLAEQIDAWATRGRAHTAWLIGGSAGFSREMVRRADFVWSLSPLTFPHQLARLIVFEQLYRAMKIIRGETYHK
ncbi:MAG: 23S rRNA (pseudouridine(1915)-N(3))-methyltransferase RlmH [Hydrogenibacillus sp.]|nr:23S rRNA (pseudouridine(1915)-N(3))-methyltransferase RlmH [Hydrogenibacillus sp.]